MQLMDRVHLVGRGEWRGVPALCRGASSNVYLVDGGTEAALVDVGVAESTADILANVRAAGVDPAKIRTILLTHAHWDHAAGLSEMLKHVEAQVCGHAIAKETMETGKGIYLPEVQLKAHCNGPVHRVLCEGDVVRIGDVSLNVSELPGHTPDGLGFVLSMDDKTVCFTGDTAIGDQPPSKGVIGWIDARWQSRLLPFQASLQRLAAMGLDAIFPGHGQPHIGRGAVKTSLDNCIWRLDQLLAIPDLDTMFPFQK